MHWNIIQAGCLTAESVPHEWNPAQPPLILPKSLGCTRSHAGITQRVPFLRGGSTCFWARSAPRAPDVAPAVLDSGVPRVPGSGTGHVFITDTASDGVQRRPPPFIYLFPSAEPPGEPLQEINNK